MQRRTRIAVLAATTVAALSLAACSGGGGGSASDAATARGPITIWYSNNAAEVSWGKGMVEAWNADHPDEQISAQEIPAGKSSEEVITAAITAGTTPCLVFNNLPAATGQFQKQGGLVDLSSFEDGDSYIQARSGDIAEQYRSSDGDFYQLPWKSNPVMIFYNKDLFSAAGLDPENPKLSTYDDFLTSAKAIVSSGAADFAINPSPTSEFFQPNFDFIPLFAAQTGGQQIVEDGKATFADDDGYAVADFWASVYSDDLAGKEKYEGDAFADGKAAVAIVGPWAIAYYGDKIANWGAVPVPTENGTPADETYTFSDAKSVGMYSSCENQGTAWDVLKFATGEEQDGQLLELTGQMPIRTDLATTYSDYFTANPDYEVFGDQANRTVEDPSDPEAVAMMQALRDAYTKAVVSGDGDVKSALDEAAKKIDSLATQG
ncbi:extracellular solute-binding protein [Herbiconiux sp. YIM B11900]|uniref:extracellular solute-binding protein n=1 Tax=Herbiconiux sp. YIM B11900 TaxID=3404131 RepID=UPI003F87F116